MFKIGDGTAPVGWPSYAKFKDGIICNYKQCCHTGSLGSPSNMDCEGKNCSCTCCQFLAGKIVHGLSYGPRRE